MRRFLLALSVGFSVAVFAPSAWAGLLGSSIVLRYDYLVPGYSYDTLSVGAGVEVTCTGGGTGNANVCSALTAANQYIDIGDTSIAYSYVGTNPGGFNNVHPNGMTFQDLDPAGTILGVTLTTDIFGLDMTRVTFTDNSVSIDLGGLALGTSASFTLDLQTIPEPTALLPIVAAIGALGWTRRRYARYAAAP